MNVEKIRSDFPIFSQKIHGHPLVYLDNSATTQKPKQVIDCIVSFLSTYNSNVHRSGYLISEQASTLYESARRKVQEFIQAKHVEEIIFTSNTTAAINLVASSFGKQFVDKDDEIIVSEMEHHSNIVPWQQICKEKKAILKVIPFNDNGILDLEVFEELLSKKTIIVALSHVSNTLGTINPINKIIDRAHDYNVPVLIDAAQSIQHLPINVQNLDCDFLVFSGHKMYAETGIGVLYAKECWLKQLNPITFGGGMIEHVSFEKTTFTQPPLKFEAGTGNITAAISLGAAIDYIKNIGLKSIMNHENQLISYAIDELQNLDGIKIYGNPSNRCGLVSFNLDKIYHYDAMMILDKLGIAVRSGKHCAEPVMQHYAIPGTIRASVAMYNNKNDIDRLIKGLEKVQEMHG